MSNPLVQDNDKIREMTDEEYAELKKMQDSYIPLSEQISKTE